MNRDMMNRHMKPIADKLESLAEDAAQRKRIYQQKTAVIQRNTDLTADAKARLLAAERETHANEMASLRQQATAVFNDSKVELERSAFGPRFKGSPPSPGDLEIMRQSQRHALALADQAKSPNELLSLLTRAQRSSDATLVLAIGQTAYERGLQGVIDEWALVEPDRAEYVAAIRDLDAAKTASRMERQMVFGTASPGV